MTVIVASTFGYRIRDHGVHTALRELVEALRAADVDVRLNELRACGRAALTVVVTPGPLSSRYVRAAGEHCVVYAHVTPETLRNSLRFERLWLPLAERYLRRFYRTAPRLVAVSEAVRDELEALGVAPDRIAVVPNGIDVERYRRPVDAALTAPLRRPGRPLVLGVGQVQPRKGVDVFAAVAAALADCDFVWVGGRPFRSLTKPARVAGRPANLRFAGRVPEAELAAYYQAADVFLFPSRQENFGQVVVEAAASGLPLVLSALPVFERSYGEAAVLCGSVDEYGAAVRALVDDPVLRRERGAAAARLAGRFTAGAAVATLLALVPTPAARSERPALAGAKPS